MNYIQKIKNELEKELHLEETPFEDLLGMYALLVLTVGTNCTNENIHDAWSVWQDTLSPTHPSLIPYKKLRKKVQNLDTPYCLAVRKVAFLKKYE